jgi:glutamate-1-semialdehyde 2,1-aminomutase
MITKRSASYSGAPRKSFPAASTARSGLQSVGGSPLFIRRASGRIEDVDGNHRRLRHVGTADPRPRARGLVKALGAAAKDGTSFGAPSPLEVELGERVRVLMPSLERVRFVSSGTEAAMSALRVARAATGRDRILKFEGCYHGHADAFLVKAGSGALTLGTPTSPGVTRGTSADTLVGDYNDVESVGRVFGEHRDPVGGTQQGLQ